MATITPLSHLLFISTIISSRLSWEGWLCFLLQLWAGILSCPEMKDDIRVVSVCIALCHLSAELTWVISEKWSSSDSVLDRIKRILKIAGASHQQRQIIPNSNYKTNKALGRASGSGIICREMTFLTFYVLSLKQLQRAGRECSAWRVVSDCRWQGEVGIEFLLKTVLVVF